MRATGDLRIATDWSLPAPGPDLRAAAPHAGDTSLVLRAAGNLNLAYGISSGFRTAGEFVPQLAASSDRGGSLRAVGGADLSSADVLATAGSSGDVVIGRDPTFTFESPPPVSLRTTTGSIDVRAARDIRFANRGATVYTTGAPVSAPIDLSPIADDLISGDFGPLSPFLAGGGSVSLGAGRDIVGNAPDPARPYVTDWWWRSAVVPAWWSRYDLFDQGIATLGGGDIALQAGRDVVNVRAAAASNGYVDDSTPGSVTAVRLGGGSVSARAGRDLVNGLYFASGTSLGLTAGNDIRHDPTLAGPSFAIDPGVQLVYENTAVRVQAGGDLTLASVRNAGYTAPVLANTTASQGNEVLTGLGDAATLVVQSLSGDVAYRAAEQGKGLGQNLPAPREGSVNPRQLLPGSTAFLAPAGRVSLGGKVAIAPSADGRALVLGEGDVEVAGLQMLATAAAAPRIEVGRFLEVEEALRLRLPGQTGGPLDSSDRQPVRIVSAAGGVTLSQAVESVRPVRFIAGGDLTLGAIVSIQHQPNAIDPATGQTTAVSELSLLQAGRDVGVAGSSNGVEIAGSGDLVVLAGRQIDLGQGAGITALGNTRNSTALPVGAANIALVAGLRGDGADYQRAARSGFAVLGASGLDKHAGDLYAWLTKPTPPPAGSSPAVEFDALPVTDQLARVESLLGKARYDTAIAGFVRARPRSGELGASDALKAFDALPESERRQAVTTLLGQALGDLPASSRTAFVALAAADRSAADQAAFVAWVARAAPLPSTGATAAPLTLAEAVARFDALPVERQAVWLNQVLVGELRAAGREAASKGGEDRDLAYARGYRAVDTLFPADAAGARPAGDIRLPTSQIKTTQVGDIVLMAPGGGINAGELIGTTAKKPADLGIVTVAGGDISAVVRKDFEVNQSRVFSLQEGDILLWASTGNIDAGRGAKTVTGAPAPVLRLDAQGRVVLDTSGSFSGSGIAVLDAKSSLDLYAPEGEINAGEAGIKSLGNAFFGAVTFVGADNLSVGGVAVGAPPAPPSVGATAGLAAAAQSVSAANQNAGSEESEEEKRRKRRARRTLLLDFLGFGEKT